MSWSCGDCSTGAYMCTSVHFSLALVITFNIVFCSMVSGWCCRAFRSSRFICSYSSICSWNVYFHFGLHLAAIYSPDVPQLTFQKPTHLSNLPQWAWVVIPIAYSEWCVHLPQTEQGSHDAYREESHRPRYEIAQPGLHTRQAKRQASFKLLQSTQMYNTDFPRSTKRVLRSDQSSPASGHQRTGWQRDWLKSCPPWRATPKASWRIQLSLSTVSTT